MYVNMSLPVVLARLFFIIYSKSRLKNYKWLFLFVSILWVFYFEIALNSKLKTSMNDSNTVTSLLGLGGFHVIFQLDIAMDPKLKFPWRIQILSLNQPFLVVFVWFFNLTVGW